MEGCKICLCCHSASLGPINRYNHALVVYHRSDFPADKIDSSRGCPRNRRVSQGISQVSGRYPVGVHSLHCVAADPRRVAEPVRIEIGHSVPISYFTYSSLNPSPQRLTWPTEGEGKCIVQHKVSV